MQQGDIKEAYHHIESPTILIKKDGKFTKKRSLTEFSSETFGLLKNYLWCVKRKYDGTNMRIYWDGNRAVWNGKTNKFAPTEEITKYMDNLIAEEVFEEVFGRKEVMIFGELMGEKIQGNELGLGGLNLVVFDIKINGIWLDFDGVSAIAGQMGLEVCATESHGTLEHLIERVRSGRYKDFEGIVAEPVGRLKDHKGDRIICKIKNKDYIEEDR